MTDLRTKVAQQMGNLMLASLELAHELEATKAKVDELGKRLHETVADASGPSGQTTPPDTLRGD